MEIRIVIKVDGDADVKVETPEEIHERAEAAKERVVEGNPRTISPEGLSRLLGPEVGENKHRII